MAWKFLDSVPDINGPYSYSTNADTTWETALNRVNSSGLFYQIYNTGDTFVYISSNNSYSSNIDGSSKVVNTSFGSTITMEDGGFSFNTNWKPPGQSSILNPGIWGLMVNESFRIIVNEDIEEAEILLLTSFYNSPWYTCIYCLMYHYQNQRLAFYQYIMDKIYRWQSVTSLTGKGKTVQLSTLNDINDGNEVTTSDTSKFNLNKSSNIKNLVDAVI